MLVQPSFTSGTNDLFNAAEGWLESIKSTVNGMHPSALWWDYPKGATFGPTSKRQFGERSRDSEETFSSCRTQPQRSSTPLCMPRDGWAQPPRRRETHTLYQGYSQDPEGADQHPDRAWEISIWAKACAAMAEEARTSAVKTALIRAGVFSSQAWKSGGIRFQQRCDDSFGRGQRLIGTALHPWQG